MKNLVKPSRDGPKFQNITPDSGAQNNKGGRSLQMNNVSLQNPEVWHAAALSSNIVFIDEGTSKRAPGRPAA